MKVLAAVAFALSLSPAATAAPFTLLQTTPGLEAEALPALGLHRAEPVSRALGVWRLRTEVAKQIAPGLRRDGLLRRAEPDARVEVLGRGDLGDPLLAGETWLSVVGADRVEPPGPGKPLTVIDSGVDFSHPEFAGRPGTTALNTQSTLGREEFHGTAVASVAGAPVNRAGLVGLYPQVTLNAWDASPNGQLDLSAIIEGIDTASQLGPGVINLSIGVGGGASDLVRDAVLLAVSRGSVVVAAAGNDRESGSAEHYPAYVPHVLTVGATDDAGTAVAGDSNQTRMVDLAAPGTSIAAVPATTRRSGYLTASGTSFAAPMVAAAAAWVWTVRPDLDHTQVFELMRRSARDLGPAGFDEDTGWGLLDVPNALIAPTPLADPLEPNDDVDHVSAVGLFRRAAAPLTTPTIAKTAIGARLDSAEDPEDVYRAFVPAGRSLEVRLGATADATLEAWSNATETVLERGLARPTHRLARSARAGNGSELVTIPNRTKRGTYVYVDVSLADGVKDAAYSLALATKPLPKQTRTR